MKKVILDANVCIDLLKVDLFEPFLRMKWEKHITDMVFTEIKEPNVQQMIDAVDENRLNLVSLEGKEQHKLYEIRGNHPALSIPDCSCYYFAKDNSLTILTGEKPLTNIAKEENIKVHGTLYVLLEMVNANVITESKAHRKLTDLIKKNPRLPTGECNKLLKRWKPEPVRVIRFRKKQS